MCTPDARPDAVSRDAMPKTLVVADESPTIRKIVELTFSDSEIRVVAAESGAEARSGLETVRPDLVLADIGLREPSGYELCRAVKSSERPVPVILLAGTFQPLDLDLAAECGADGHLVKPFESGTLREKVGELLEPPPVEAAEAVEVDQDEQGEETEDREEPPLPDGVSQELVDAVARRVVQTLSRDTVREIARELVPEMAEEIIRQRIREIENGES